MKVNIHSHEDAMLALVKAKIASPKQEFYLLILPGEPPIFFVASASEQTLFDFVFAREGAILDSTRDFTPEPYP